ncbi:MAG: cytidine deaminase [Pyrinomonadaceae bacterium]|nr:cytidine deaminase [Pyrinomonadaceae bacterium]
MAETNEKLIESARKTRENAFAPFSNFKVGASIETADGEIFTGCNVENASYGLTVCAERVAIWKAVSEGKRDFKRICIVADTEKLTPPCGACRQIIWEFCGDVPVILANLRGDTETFTMRELLPNAFGREFLNE